MLLSADQLFVLFYSFSSFIPDLN